MLTGGECLVTTNLGLPFSDAWIFSTVDTQTLTTLDTPTLTSQPRSQGGAVSGALLGYPRDRDVVLHYRLVTESSLDCAVRGAKPGPQSPGFLTC